jgi:hypothetical protein
LATQEGKLDENNTPSKPAMVGTLGGIGAGAGIAHATTSHIESEKARPQQVSTMNKDQQLYDSRELGVQQFKDEDQALGSFASSVQARRRGGSGEKKIMHKCRHCGEEDDISEYFAQR